MNTWRFSHVGVLVADLDKAAEYYQSFGIGPFGFPEGLTLMDREVYGKPASDVKNRAGLAQLGPTKIELVQPVSGKSVQKEFLDKHGEGINRIAFEVDDIEKETAKLLEKGFKVISSGKFVGGGFAYFDTDKVGGVIFEMFQLPPGISV